MLFRSVTQSDLTKQLLLLKLQREKELADKKEALLTQRKDAQEKKAADEARKRHEQALKKSEVAGKKKIAAAEMREKKKLKLQCTSRQELRRGNSSKRQKRL